MITILMGVYGSGKSTIGQKVARDLGWIFIAVDEYHSEHSIARMKRAVSLTDEDRYPWLLGLDTLIKQLDNKHRMALLACSALKKKYRTLLRGHGADITFSYLKADFHLIEERMSSRSDHLMPVSLLQSQFKDLEEPEEVITIDAANGPEWIVSQIRDNLLTII